MDDIKGKIKAMLVERLMLDVAPGDVKDDQDLAEAYDLDSVRLFELVIGTEEEFDISFEDDEFDMEKFSTVNSIAQVIQEKLDE
ncbi:acyl carrier protein [Planctomycetota bacterium]